MNLRRTFTAAILTSAGLMCGCAQSNLVPAPMKSAFANASRRVGGNGAAQAASDASSRQNSYAMARLCEQRGEMDAARKLYAECIAIQPNNPAAYHRLGVIAAEEGNLDAALAQFQQAMELAPPKNELLSDLGYCLYLMNDLQAAEQVLRDGLMQQPNDQSICNNLALVCSDTGRFEEALDLFKRVNTEAEAYSNIAYAYSQAGELEKAKEFYSQALSVNENLQVAAQAMMQVAERQSRIEQSMPAPQSQPPTSIAQADELLNAVPTSESEAWQSQQESSVQLASQNSPANSQPEVVIEDGPLRWRSANGQPKTSVGFVGVPMETRSADSPASDEPQQSFLRQHSGTTIRDENVRPISAQIPALQDVRYQTVQSAVYQYPVSQTPHATDVEAASFGAMNEPGLMPRAVGAEAPKPLPTIDIQPAAGRLGVLDLPFIPKRHQLAVANR